MELSIAGIPFQLPLKFSARMTLQGHVRTVPMEEESLPREFVETIRTGWWTTCLEILPAKERARGRY